jgi:hypothetical protein
LVILILIGDIIRTIVARLGEFFFKEDHGEWQKSSRSQSNAFSDESDDVRPAEERLGRNLVFTGDTYKICARELGALLVLIPAVTDQEKLARPQSPLPGEV